MSADLVRSSDHTVTKATVDGWVAEASLVNVLVNTVPNLAQSPWSREAFIDATAVGNISGSGSTGVKSGVLRTGLQLGCNTDVSSGLQTGSSGSIGPNASVTVSAQPGVTLGGNASISPQIQTTIKPGAITTIPLGERVLEGAVGASDLTGIQVNVDSCLGPVSVRVYTQFSISSHVADTTVTVYSDPTTI
ncbi:MspA family porin [Nocardia sp. 2]|uniref:MspA family porin n=1 Tax=Nocardia acididurans TaxID=2802282 RepID=A0ABS1MEU0_9NOCA|nr:MspA family porin [Nocardia acididurans]MBL1079171.1 MspA family porin [Nocardia acididurans]